MRGAVLWVLLAACALAIAFPAAAAADEPAAAATAAPHPDWRDRPVESVVVGFGMAVLVLLALVGLGCAVALLGAVFSGIQAAADRQARALGAGWPFAVGSLVLVGVGLALGGAAGTRSQPLVGAVTLLVVLPAFLLVLLGALAGLPLLGERLLGARGPQASPLRRCVVASVALGLAALPGLVFPPFLAITVLAVFTAVGWPLGLGLATVMRRAGPRNGVSAGSPAA